MKSVGKGRSLEVLQQIQQKTKDSLCIRSCFYSSSHKAVTLPPSQELLWHRGLSYLVWNMERGILWDTGGKGTAHSHHLHSALILGSQLPSFYWESKHTGPLQWWSSVLGLSEVQIPRPSGPCHSQPVCPSQLPSPDLAWGCSWVWKCVRSQHPIINIPSVFRIRPSAGDAFSNLRNIKMSPYSFCTLQTVRVLLKASESMQN